jgi:hypothetical protein
MNMDKDKFSNVAESLKKYRRAELRDENGKNVLDEMYVDLMVGDVVIKKCLLDHTTYLIGRKGTGKSTIFLKLESEYRKKKQYLPCYIDVKTVFESSQAQEISSQYLSDFLDTETLKKYLISRCFIQNVLMQIYDEVDKQRKTFFTTIVNKFSGNTDEKIKERIKGLQAKVKNNEKLTEIELPVLKQRKIKIGSSDRTNSNATMSANSNFNLSDDIGISSGLHSELSKGTENNHDFETEFSEVMLKVFEVKNIISELQNILEAIGIFHLVIMLDDVSEIDGVALKMFIDTVVAPLNNWSNEFIKFKIAFYPNRVHYGNIDPGKIDTINLDFYNLYSGFDKNRMEENAVNFTKRLLENRFTYYSISIRDYIDEKIKLDDIYTIFFYASMNVPRIIGYLLSYLYESNVIYDKRITKSDIENASMKYYDEKIDAFFKASAYGLFSIDEKRNIADLKKMRDAIVKKAQNIKTQITSGALSGKYLKNMPYSSHFHVLQDMDKYLTSLELNHVISKYEEMSNRDGKKVNIYCLNYGLAKKNNIIWGKPSGGEYRKYFIERPFNYTNLILDEIKEVQIIQCQNKKCARRFDESELSFLQFTHFKCPDCGTSVLIEKLEDKDVAEDIKNAKYLKELSVDGLNVVIELYSRKKEVLARDIAVEIDMSSSRVGRVCKKLAEDGIIDRSKKGNIYWYKLTEYGMQYCSQD